MFGAAIVAAMVTPAIAHADDTKGTIGVQYNNWDPQGSGSNLSVYGLDGAISHDFSNGWTIQGDASTERLHDSGFSAGESHGDVSFGMRHDQYSLYGFVGMSTYFGASGTDLGIGGQLFFPNIVVDGSIGYVDFADAHFHTTQANIDATYFINDNLGITGSINHAKFSGSGPDTDSTGYGVSGSYRFAAHPITLSLGYTKNDTDFGDLNVWHVGLAWDFGSDSLHDRATHGPGWNGANQLYNITQTIF